MSHRRFWLLQRYLHFSDNAAFDPQNHECPKLVKVWPVLKHLNEKFSETVTPERDVTIDESLMLFKGRLGWKQFIPLKRARFGVECFMLCESISGYVWSIIIYTGKDTILKPEYSKFCFSSQIVLTMMEPLLHKGYCLTIDNYYSSPELANKLVSCRTDAYGTLNLKRKEVPKEMQKKKIEKEEITAFQRGKVTVMKWMDKKKVSLLSTIHNTEMEQIQVRSEMKEKPKIVMDYNNTMGGVDRMDQNLKSFEIIKKRGKKCYGKIFFHIFDIAVWNSYVVYRKNGGKSTQLEFRLDLIDRVIEKCHSGLNFHRGRPGSEPNPLRLTETFNVCGTSLRPDITARVGNNVFIVDVTCPFEGNDSAFSSDGRVDDFESELTPTEVCNDLKKKKTLRLVQTDSPIPHLRPVDPGAKVLTKIFNSCLRFRRVPRLWKLSTTILIPKGGDLDMVSNWRPIELSNTEYKTFTKCLAARLTNWCERFDVLSPCQKGFMPFDGVLEHNFILQQSVEKTRSAKHNICIAWLDVTNAFGSLPHGAIFDSLRSNGRCPLSGLLFNIAIDPVLREIQSTSSSHQILAFADDICLIASSRDELQVHPNEVQHLLGRLNHHLNPGKSFSYHFQGTTPVGILDTEFFLGANKAYSLMEGEFRRFLGKPVGLNPVPNYSSFNDLAELGVKLARSKLTPWQRDQRSVLLPLKHKT
ncbi:piggyBac transposable element-derived protein 4 [Caerostris extrusa]|uniref:PiggyBac transposable element-derived protein 4 n=1 Tax=Caerostris extrusa TaxID=172846 RepID=A0AAV4QT76_CAEEX|nr:piggyBac transposable element-derived protein 4 [Caerostris extrusa]